MVRFPAGDGTPEPDPLVLIAGGPGQAGTEALGPTVRALLRLRATRDVLVVDARGTGQSSLLPCPPSALDPVTLLAGPPAARAAERARVATCRDAFPGDLGQYGTAALVADLEAVRSALGVERWNVWGGSYGTRVAQEYARAHPERVRSLILDGVVPPTARPIADAAASADRAVEEVLAACASEPACAAEHPDLPARWDGLRARLAAAPLAASTSHPRTGAPVAVHLDGDDAARLVRLLSYAPESAAWIPEVVVALERGEPGPLLAALLPLVSEVGRSVNPLQQLAVTCPEDAARLVAADVEVPGVALARSMCDGWPAPAVEPSRWAPLRGEVPVLLLSGGLDPVTPPSGAEEVARTLPRAVQVVAPGYGHGLTVQGCVADLVASFVEEPDGSGFSEDCLSALERMGRPGFLVGGTRLSP